MMMFHNKLKFTVKIKYRKTKTLDVSCHVMSSGDNRLDFTSYKQTNPKSQSIQQIQNCSLKISCQQNVTI